MQFTASRDCSRWIKTGIIHSALHTELTLVSSAGLTRKARRYQHQQTTDGTSGKLRFCLLIVYFAFEFGGCFRGIFYGIWRIAGLQSPNFTNWSRRVIFSSTNLQNYLDAHCYFYLFISFLFFLFFFFRLLMMPQPTSPQRAQVGSLVMSNEVSMTTSPQTRSSSSGADTVSPLVTSEVANQLRRIGDELMKSHDPKWLNRRAICDWSLSIQPRAQSSIGEWVRRALW